MAFATVAMMGARYGGLWRFDDVTFRRGGNLVVGDRLEVNDTLALAELGLLMHPETTTQYEAIPDLEVATLSVDASSRIDVSARGYIGGRDFAQPGRTLANAFGSGPVARASTPTAKTAPFFSSRCLRIRAAASRVLVCSQAEHQP